MRLLFTISFLFFALCTHAQLGISGALTIKGRVTDATTGEVIATATVVNVATQESSYTDVNGYYSIYAHEGDQLAFSIIGYRTGTLTIKSGSEYLPQSIALKRQNIQMSEFIVRPKYTPYQADSISRYSTYKRTLLRRHEGSVMSPVTFLAERVSGKSKRMFRFQKDFARLEDERFIETRYSPEMVAKMTQLSGDTLAFFMNAYPMPYDYARAASELELKMWVRNNYREWLAKGRPVPKITTDTVLKK